MSVPVMLAVVVAIRACGGGRSFVGAPVARATGATGHRSGGAGARVAADAERPVGHF
jgi:hypothetical protein